MKGALSSCRIVRARWPLVRPFVTALGRKSHSDNVLVRVRLAGGAEGWGEASSSLAMAWQTGPKMAAALRRLAGRFKGRDVRDVEKAAAEARRAEPDMPTAAAAFETALWDALARSEGIPFYKLWGGKEKRLVTLMSVSAVGADEVAARVREGRRKGFRTFKLKLNGREPEALNMGRIRAAHRASPRARLLLDPNQSYLPPGLSSLLAAVRRDGLPVDLVEEPFPKGDWKTLASFRGKSSLPIILDESVQTGADARRALHGRLAQGVNVKLAKSGLTEGKKIVDLCEKERSSLMIGCMAESSLGLAVSVQFAMGTGAFDFADLDSDLLLKAVPVDGGYLRRGPEIFLPRNPAPGLGAGLRPMIQNPFLLIAVFVGLVALLKAVRPRVPFRAVFNVLPVPFWCYVLPMVGATAGLFPATSPIYDLLSRWALPLCLALFLVGVDLKLLTGLSRPALLMMAAGCLGIMAGAVAAAALFKHWLPPESWKSLGALAASWTGGSANMLAVKEALSAPESVFAPVVVTDSLFAYLWMGLLMTAAAHQARFDRWVGAPAADAEVQGASGAGRGSLSFVPAFMLALALAALSVFLGARLPVVGSILTHGTWTVLLVTSFSLAASALLRRDAAPGVEKTGTFLLFILLVSMGSRATLTAAARSPVFLAAGAVMLAVHAVVLLAAARAAKAPLFLVATASQACVGGTVSAPMVAATYRPALAAAGLLMAILGNVVGTYLGLLTATVCRGVSR